MLTPQARDAKTASLAVERKIEARARELSREHGALALGYVCAVHEERIRRLEAEAERPAPEPLDLGAVASIELVAEYVELWWSNGAAEALIADEGATLRPPRITPPHPALLIPALQAWCGGVRAMGRQVEEPWPGRDHQ